MASLDEAELARRTTSAELARLGAHSIGVERIDDGWCVVAYLEAAPASPLPPSLEVRLDRVTVQVPVVVRFEEPFTPE